MPPMKHRASAARRSLALAAALALGTVSTPALSAPPDVAELAKRLLSDDWADREAAEAALAALDAESLDALDEAAKGTGEAADRCQAAAESIRARHALEASVVELPAGPIGLMPLLRDLADQANVELHVHPSLALQTVEVTPGEATFWAAVADLCADHTLDAVVNAGGPRNLTMSIVPARDETPRQLAGPARVAGPGIVVVREVTRTSRVDFAGFAPALETAAESARGESARYALEALIEPRFQIGPRDFRVVWTRATDGNGRSLLPANEGETFEVDPTNAVVDADGGLGGARPIAEPAYVSEAKWSAGRLRFDLTLVPDAEQRRGETVTLAGHVEGLVGHDFYTADVGEAEPVVWLIGGEPMSVRLHREPARNAATSSSMSLLLRAGRPVSDDVRRIIGDALDGSQITIDGQTLTRGATRVHDIGGRLAIDVAFVGADDGEATATCEVPRRTMMLKLPFRFDGLPLP